MLSKPAAVASAGCLPFCAFWDTDVPFEVVWVTAARGPGLHDLATVASAKRAEFD